MKSFFITLFLICITFTYADSDQEIRIYLPTASSLEPTYFGKLSCADQSLSQSYLDQLEQILRFDFSHNGRLKMLQTQAAKEQILAKPKLQEALNSVFWKNQGVAYVVKATVAAHQLSIQILSPQNNSLKQFSNIELTGTLSQDRQILHRLSDAITKEVLGEVGVASTRILFSCKTQQKNNSRDWHSEIWTCDWDGGNLRQLTREGSYCVSPVFLPKNNTYKNDRFLYVSYKMGQPKIFIASLQEGIGKRLIDLKGNQLLPAISQQRDKIAFISDAGGRTDLFLQEFHPDRGEAGKPMQLFSFPRSTQASPTFNPEGSKLAFVSDMDGSPRIYIIPTSFSDKRATPTLLTKINRENSCPAWSPDGKKLAYSAKTKGIRQIWIYDFETQTEQQLTDGPGNKENPSWASNSKHIVFNSADGQTSELYIVNLSQPDVVKISLGSGIKHYPSWGNR